MKQKTKILIYLTVFALMDVLIPFPVTATILIYVVLDKPEWFKKLVSEIYTS